MIKGLHVSLEKGFPSTEVLCRKNYKRVNGRRLYAVMESEGL